MPAIAESIVRQIASPAARKLEQSAGRELTASTCKTVARDTLAKAARATLNPDLAKLLDNPTLANQVTFHLSTEESHQALLQSIANAQHSFYVETFIWHNDQAGKEVADALINRKQAVEAAGGKFDAKVLVDWIGLHDAGGDDQPMVDYLRKNGVDVKIFSPGYLNLDAMRVAPITHRKLYIQDGSQFITGGRNIGNEYELPTYTVPGTNTTEVSWNDMLYTVKGEETGRILDRFFTDWKKAGGKVPHRAAWPTVEPHVGPKVAVQSIVTDPYSRTKEILAKHMQAIAAAKKDIVAIYPYFSDDDLINALIAAKKANPALRVRAVMPSCAEPSHDGSLYAVLNRETARRLLNGGVEVRWYAGGEVDGKAVNRFSHMKGMAIDGELLSIGSGNADARTYADNHELNTLIHDRETAQRYMNLVAEPEWAQSTPATIADLNKDSLWDRTKQKVLRLFEFAL
ncbi:MAG TPA: phosphatidylserine/phosphatidylglycerophosphate/cardiolipin synthase family protein [Oscillatoriaceae cyanobacterium]